MAIVAAPVAAADFAAGSICHANAASNEGWFKVAQEPARWTCGDEAWSIASPRTILRFDLGGEQRLDRQTFVTRLTRFGSLRLTAVAADGRVASRSFRPGE